MEPMILPELAGVAVADGPSRGSTEEQERLVVGREVEMLPGAVRAGALQPQPPAVKGDASTVQFADPQPTKRKGATHLLPRDDAAASMGVLVAVP